MAPDRDGIGPRLRPARVKADPIRVRTPRKPLAAALLLSCAACSITSDSFVERFPGYSVTRGRLLSIENLSSTTVTPLADGAAFQVAGPSRVTLEFHDGEQQELELQPPDVLVCGTDHDFVLQPAVNRHLAAPPPEPRQ
jgi:hypothetical protein